jgi:hypothetical protein
VVGYDRERQDFLMKYLGLGGLTATQLGVLAVAIAGGLLAVVGLWVVLQRPARRDPVVATYDRLCRKLARAGVARAPHEGPRDYLTRAAVQLPQAGEQLRTIGRLYEHLRYGRRAPREAVRQLQRAVRQLSVGAMSPSRFRSRPGGRSHRPIP